MMTTADDNSSEFLLYGQRTQENWVQGVLDLALSSPKRVKLLLLTGDAGTGKTHAIKSLRSRAQKLHLTVCLCAPTAKAAGVINAALDAPVATTYHHALGFKEAMLRAVGRPRDEFMKLYRAHHGPALDAFRGLVESRQFDTAIVNAPCGHAEFKFVCATCRLRMRKLLRGRDASLDFPPFFLASVIFIDEYGMIGYDMYRNIREAIACFSVPGEWSPVLIFAGSVSQLPPAKNKDSGPVAELWGSPDFCEDIFHVQNLIVNRRQMHDAEYGESLSYMQFNLVPRTLYDIIRSRTAKPGRANDPRYKPYATRIFHQNKLRDDYMAKLLETVDPSKRYRRVTSAKLNPKEGGNAFEVTKYLVDRYPKLFARPETGHTSNVKDYARCPVIWPGCKVFLVPFGSQCSFRDQEGTVLSVDRKSQTIRVEGSITKSVYAVEPVHEKYRGAIVTTHPVSNCAAINTYEAQGATLPEGVIYSPPQCYRNSPLKASAYVACTRTVRREGLEVDNSGFVPRVGEYPYYPDGLVHFRKKIEMSYTANRA